MEALIIAGGLGSRLRPLTDRRPKHVLPVAGVPFLGHQLAKLATTGVEHVVLATSYRAAEFRPVFGDAIWKIQGDIKTGREIYFALYQAIGDSGAADDGIFRDFFSKLRTHEQVPVRLDLGVTDGAAPNPRQGEP